MLRIRRHIKLNVGLVHIDKLEKLMLRISAFSVMYIVPAVLSLACAAYQFAMLPRWMTTWLVYRALSTQLQVPLALRPGVRRLGQPLPALAPRLPASPAQLQPGAGRRSTRAARLPPPLPDVAGRRHNLRRLDFLVNSNPAESTTNLQRQDSDQLAQCVCPLLHRLSAHADLALTHLLHRSQTTGCYNHAVLNHHLPLAADSANSVSSRMR